MPKTISQLPAATVISGSAVVAADNAAGTLTERVTLAAIAGLASSGLQTSLDSKVSSITTGITGADQITNLVSLTQAEYTALATKSATTLYVING
jgi:hypothetical protein